MRNSLFKFFPRIKSLISKSTQWASTVDSPKTIAVQADDIGSDFIQHEEPSNPCEKNEKSYSLSGIDDFYRHPHTIEELVEHLKKKGFFEKDHHIKELDSYLPSKEEKAKWALDKERLDKTLKGTSGGRPLTSDELAELEEKLKHPDELQLRIRKLVEEAAKGREFYPY